MTNPAEAQSLSPEQRHTIASIFETLPQDSVSRYAAVQSIRLEFYENMAKSIEVNINELLREHRLDNPEDYRRVATLANSILRSCGLIASCPRTGLPAILVACPVRGGETQRMKFQFEVRGQDGIRTRTAWYRDLPWLTLQPSPQRIESLARPAATDRSRS
jgi:hypothetical protein